MSSTSTLSDILERLSEWSEEDLKQNIENILPTLLSSLSSDDEGQRFQVVQVLLTNCLPCLPLNDAEERVLQHAIPAARQLFTDALECIHSSLDEGFATQSDDLGDKLESFLQICLTLLRCTNTVLEYISSQGRVQLDKICSVPVNVARLLLETFQHCKDSENVYGEYFSFVSDPLSTVVRESHQIQVHFFNVVTENVQFNCYVEDDLGLLIDVLETVSLAGEVLFSLDIKVMAEQWKGYTRLTQTYRDHLQRRLSVAKPLSALASEVEKQIEAVKSPSSDKKSVVKLLKVGGFLLKIIIKLCEQFGGYLRESGSNLLHLILTLYRHSSIFCKSNGLEDSLIEDIERYIVVAADPLLGLVLNEYSFQNDFFMWCNQMSDRSENNVDLQVPTLILVISVVKQLLHCDPDIRAEWTSKHCTSNIFSAIFSIVKSGHEVFTKHVNVQMAVGVGLNPRSMDLYGALVAHAGALIVSAKACEIQTAEQVLLMNILQLHPWAALLASDLWCILSRTASSEMCLEQILCLIDILELMLDRNILNRPEKVHLCLHIRRLEQFLNTQEKILVMETLASKSNPVMWQAIALESIPELNRIDVANQIVSHTQDSIVQFLNNGVGVENFVKTVAGLYGLTAALQNDSPSNASKYLSRLEIGLSLWERIPQDEFILKQWLTVAEVHDSLSFWLEYFVGGLCRMTEKVISIMSNQQILQVLARIHAIIPQSSVIIKLNALKLLKGLARKSFDIGPDQILVCSNIASLFAVLLQDSDPILCFSALEVFAYFAHNTKHANIFVSTVEGNRNLQQVVTTHLQKSPIPSQSQQSERLNLQDYFKAQSGVKFFHKCVVRKPPKDVESVPAGRPAKKLKLDEDVSLDISDFLSTFSEGEFVQAINRMKEDSDLICAYGAINSVPESSLCDLRSVISKLENVTKVA